MSNYNTTLQSNNTYLQAILNTINELPEASGDPILQDKTVTPTTSQQTVAADDGYDGLDTVTVNAMPTTTQATPSITINASGLITATATQTAGYVTAGSKSSTKQLAFQTAKTITPTTTSQIAVSSGYYTGGNITVAAIPSTYVQPSGTLNITTNGTHDVTNYKSATVNVANSGGGNSGNEDGIIKRTITSCTNDRVTTIGTHAFAECSKLTTVSFPVCTSIDLDAFYACKNLVSVSFPACSDIFSSAFYYCWKLSEANFPNCTRLDGGAFYSCVSLKSASFPVCPSIGSNAFYNCSNLASVSFPVCTSIAKDAFRSCSRLKTVSFPVCTTISTYAFGYCYSLTTVSFPKCEIIGWSAFACCSKLTTVSFPACTSIASKAFRDCKNLSLIYLKSTNVCTLGNSDVFSNTKITSTTGVIYVPSSLVNSYKTATNWTYFSNRILGV